MKNPTTSIPSEHLLIAPKRPSFKAEAGEIPLLRLCPYSEAPVQCKEMYASLDAPAEAFLLDTIQFFIQALVFQ